MKEAVLRAKLVRSIEKLKGHSQEPDPLAQGDEMFIQKQDAFSIYCKRSSKQGNCGDEI